MQMGMDLYQTTVTNRFLLFICCQEWPKEFTLSDHRMIMTEFELETKESRQPDSQTSDQAGSRTV